MMKKLLPEFAFMNPNVANGKSKSISFSTNGISYEITSLTTVKVITNKQKSYASSVVIPNTVTYKGINYRVTKIGAYAFANNYNLYSVTIPNSISSIAEKAFANDYSLVQIVCNITEPLAIDTSVFGYATENCQLIVPTTSLAAYKKADVWKKFSSVTDLFPFTVKGITYEITSKNTVKVVLNIVEGYKGSISIPATVQYNKNSYKVTEISNRAFSFNKKITSMRIGSNIIRLSNSTFDSCSNLTFVYVPKSVISIGSSAFEDCVRLSCITMPSAINNIQQSTFARSGLANFTFSSTVSTLKNLLRTRISSQYAKSKELKSVLNSFHL